MPQSVTFPGIINSFLGVAKFTEILCSGSILIQEVATQINQFSFFSRYFQGRRCNGTFDFLSDLNGWPVQFLWETDMCKIDDGSGQWRENVICKFQNFKNTTPALTRGGVSQDHRCHQYSNLNYPLGIGPLRFFVV